MIFATSGNWVGGSNSTFGFAANIGLMVGGGDIIAHRTFGQEQVLRRITLLDIADHGGRAAGKIGRGNHFWAAFGMRQDRHVGYGIVRLMLR